MAYGVTIGGVVVPVLREATYAQPQYSTSYYLSLPSAQRQSTSDMDAYRYWSPSNPIGLAYVAGSDAEHGSAQRTYRFPTGFTINLHGGATITVSDAVDSGSSYPAKNKENDATPRANGDPTYSTSSTFFFSNGVNSWQPNGSKSVETRMFADRIKYQDGSPNAYQLNIIEHVVTVVNARITEEYRYVRSSYINPAQWVHYNSIAAYIDETVIPDPETPFDPSTPDDYTPTIDNTSDTITLPPDPTIGVTDVGFINVYNPSANALVGLGDFIFPDPIPDITQVTDVLVALIKICQTLANSNLINYVIDCHVIPTAPHTSGSANIKVGFRDTGINVPVVDSDYITVACGSVNIAEYFHGFQHYNLTRSKLYLPFVGFVDCKPEWWQGGTLTVDYKFNVIDGSFMAYVRATSSKSALYSSIVAQYGGNACMHIPLTGVNYSSMVSGVVSAAISPASASKGASPSLGTAYSALNTIMAGGEVQQSNGYNSTAAILGIRVPYLVIERPVPSYSSGVAHEKGYPSNIYAQLSTVSGFTIIDDIDLSGVPFSDGEISELRQLLADGVYF